MFSISKVAEQLQVTPQAIYKQRDYLLDNGYMVKDKFGQWQISVQGYNYLKEKRINKLNQEHSKVDNEPSKTDNQNAQTESEPKENELHQVYRKQVELLENQIKEIKSDRDYFKSLYEEKDRQLNQYINTHLLGTGETNTEKPKGFFKRLFS